MEVDPEIMDLFGEPPEGLDLDEDNVWRSDVGLIILICLAVVSVVLRHAARFLQKAGLKADDYFMILAVCLSVGTSILVVVSFKAGAGKHVWALTPAELVKCVKSRGQEGAPGAASRILTISQLMWALSINYAAAVWAIKLSILLLYVRLFRIDDKSFRYLIYFGIFATSALALSAILALLFACEPISFFWTSFRGDTDGYYRLNIDELYISVAVVNLLLDLYLLAIPVPRVLRLQMSPRKKFIVCSSLFLGIIICAAGALRIFYLISFVVGYDPSWHLGPLALWSSIEPAVGVVTACMPNLLPLYYWASDRIKLLRYGDDRTGDAASRRTAGFDANRLPTYVENNLVLRPKEDDEIRLTTLATAARGDSTDSLHYGAGIVVRSEVTQTVEDGPKKANSF